MPVSAVIAGAGKSLRFAGDNTSPSSRRQKQFQLLGDQPLIFVTIRRFIESDYVDSLVVAVPEDSVDWMGDAVKTSGFKKEVKVISGGEERQDTVWKGLKEVSGICEVIVVHDAVRPFFEKRWIKDTVDLCSRFDGAIVAVRVSDTLKRVKHEIVLETLPRGSLWQAQTPQTFNVGVLADAFEHAQSAGVQWTDEAQLVELNGGRIGVVEGSPRNIKITTGEDWELAKSIWQRLSHD